MLSTIRMPADLSCGTASGAGVSIRSTCPPQALVASALPASESKSAWSTFGSASVSVILVLDNSASSRGTSFVSLNVLSERLANLSQSCRSFRIARGWRPGTRASVGRRIDVLVVISRLSRRSWRSSQRTAGGFHLRALALVEFAVLVVQHLVQIPDHRIGIEVAAIVEFHALRSLNRHLVLSASSTFHSVARPGTIVCRADPTRPSPRRPADH